MRSTIIILLTLLSSTTIFSQINTHIKNLANYEAMKYGGLSVCVMDVESGEVLAQHNSNLSLTPASIMKTITTGASLGILGASYRFKTELQYDGTISSDGTLNGNIYIKGYGDPTLGSEDMEGALDFASVMWKFADAIKKLGIKRLNGMVIGDGTLFETAVAAPGWQWADVGNYYGSGAGGLNINENLYQLYFQQTSTGKTPKIVRTNPALPYLVFINEVTSKGSSDNAYIFGAPYNYLHYVRGTIPAGNKQFKIKGAIPDPAYFAAYSLTQKLESMGVETNKMSKNLYELKREGKYVNLQRKNITTIQSPPLRDIIKRANFKSVNMYCEALLRTMGMKKYGKGTMENGVKAVKAFFEARGLNMEGFFMEDGSGLSRNNGATSFQMVSMLRKFARDSGIYTDFKRSLPVGGKEGTVRYMFKGTKAAGQVRLKSGSMNRVRSYAGYTQTSSGRLVSFSIIANNFMGKSTPIRSRMEKVIAAILDLP